MAEVIKINSNTWRIEDDFVRFFLLEGGDKSALIDSGANCPDAVDIAKSITSKPIILLNTHGDGDHASGTDGFSQIYIHPYDYEEVKNQFPNTPMVEIKDGDIIDLGNRPLRIIHIPGHTRGSVAILDANRRVLFAGDSVQKGYIFMFGSHRIPEKYEDSLNKLISIRDEYDCVYASHGEFMVSRDYVEKVKEAWNQVQRGMINYEMVEINGNMVKSMSTSYCGFYI